MKRRFVYPQITQISQIFKSIRAKEKAHALKEQSLVYPQITQIHADFWDFLNDYFFGFSLGEVKPSFIEKIISLICGNLRNLRIEKKRQFVQRMCFNVSLRLVASFSLQPSAFSL